MRKSALVLACFICGTGQGGITQPGATSLAPKTIAVEPTGSGRTFEGIGAVSAGASSRLLIDYPEPQRSQILDLLFKPHYGAGLQQLKVEIGADVNSTDGTEPSHERVRGDRGDSRGYEWWLMEQAQQRNPGIVFDCLAWGAPAWIGSGNASPEDFFTQDMANYLVDFLKIARDVHHIDLRLVGIWNERPFDASWIKRLRRTLDANGLEQVKIAAADQINNWKIARDVQGDAELKASVGALAVHYPHFQSTPEALATGLPLWSSEDGPWKGNWSGAEALARIYNRNYIQGRMTRTEIWSPITSYYDILPIPGSGLMRANTPWSGAFEVQPALWATAMTTQFTQPGWHYLDASSTALEGGSMVALASPGNRDVSIVIETTQAKAAQTLRLQFPPDLKPLHLWQTTQTRFFEELPAPDATGGEIILQLAPDAIYTLTTTTGQSKARPISPAESPFPLPYRDSFEEYPRGATPRFTSDQAGAFEIGDGADGHRLLRQVIEREGVRWDKNPTPETVLGDREWRDGEVSIDARLPLPAHNLQDERFFSLFGRVSKKRQNGDPLIGYWFKAGESGGWELSVEQEIDQPAGAGKKQTVALRTILASGRAPLAAGRWHQLTLDFQGDRIAARIDGRKVADVTDTRSPRGMVGFGSGWHTAEFRDLRILPSAH